jgi:Fe-S cluster biogenesis protein NfuA
MAEEVALKDKVQELLDSAINPAVSGHGGYIELIDVKDSTVYIRMSGGCQGCGAADVTLKAGIERMIFEEIPEITEVLDTTDHASGSNPYYAPSKASPASRPDSPGALGRTRRRGAGRAPASPIGPACSACSC